MQKLSKTGLILFGLLWIVCAVQAQVLVDTVFTWQGYARWSTGHVRIYQGAPKQDYTHVVVIRELAENQGPSSISDVRHLAELIGRTFHIDPATTCWIFYWGAFSYPGADPKYHKELFIRATFRRNKNQSLGTPGWRVVSREEVEVYTDRQFR